MQTDPMQRSKEELSSIVDHISVPNSPVGIDAQLTHAIIITYLQQILARLDVLETKVSQIQP
ncbi:MAG: hypothetical protein AB7G28_23475 [Pirellulales bacterium]